MSNPSRFIVSRAAAALSIAWALVTLPLGAQQTDRPFRPANHDDPIVVDNGPIVIRRPKASSNPRKDQQSEWWSFHPTAPYYTVKITSWDKTTQQPYPTLSLPLNVDDEVAFQLINKTGGKRNESFRIRQDAIENDDRRLATIASKHKGLAFRRDGRTITPKGSSEPHIGEVRFGTQFVCLSDQPKPTESPCTKWDYVPGKIEVRLCANEQCEATEH